MARKRLRRVTGCRLKVYRPPTQAWLHAYGNWALVRQNPELVRGKKALDQDPAALWWLPITWSSVVMSDVFWLDVVSVKIDGRLWPDLCRACDQKLLCADEGRGLSPKHECRAQRANLVDIQRRRKNVQAPGQ